MSDPLERFKATLRRAADLGPDQLRHVLYRAVDKTTRRCLGGDFLRELHERARAADAKRLDDVHEVATLANMLAADHDKQTRYESIARAGFVFELGTPDERAALESALKEAREKIRRRESAWRAEGIRNKTVEEHLRLSPVPPRFAGDCVPLTGRDGVTFWVLWRGTSEELAPVESLVNATAERICDREAAARATPSPPRVP